MEQNEQDRAIFMDIVNAHYLPEQLVFADESHFNRLTMRRPYAWSKRGERACQYEFQFRGAKYSILPAISISRFSTTLSLAQTSAISSRIYFRA
jgi:hypothetical protein